MSHYFMGVDLGGTVTKAGIYTADGLEIKVVELAVPLLSEQMGFCERDMAELWSATSRVIRGVERQRYCGRCDSRRELFRPR